MFGENYGTTELTVTHASDYAIVIDKEPMDRRTVFTGKVLTCIDKTLKIDGVRTG